MPSHLRLHSSFEEPIEAHATYSTTIAQRPIKKQKMTLHQTYSIASAARSKLGREAARADHNLRRLVGHANLLDQLMIDLADAERESENWLNQSIREASRPEEPRHVQWMDSIAETYEEEDESSDDESDDGMDIDQIRSAPVFVEEDDAEYDEEELEEELALRRVSSSAPRYTSPPELTLDDSDSEEEDDFVPSSPEDTVLQLSQKERETITTTALYESPQNMEDFAIQPSQQPLIAAC